MGRAQSFQTPGNFPVNALESYHSPERTRAQSVVEQAIEDYCRQQPVADPMKRPSLPKLDSKPESKPKHVHRYSTMTGPSRTMPPVPKVPAVNMAFLATSATTSSFESCAANPGEVNDKEVFKGLHVATAAACDEDIDKWIEEITGSSARKFLAALSNFDGLGVNTLSSVARRAAKQRRDKVRAWEAVRAQRLASQQKSEEPCEIGDEIVVGDQGVVLEPTCGSKGDSTAGS